VGIHLTSSGISRRLDQWLMAHLATGAEVQQALELSDPAGLHGVAAARTARAITTVDSKPA
jgi:hypothetical protein